MPIKVRLGGSVERIHPAGDDIAVTDGHLHVVGMGERGRGTIALYAPGSWVRAEEVDKDGETL